MVSLLTLRATPHHNYGCALEAQAESINSTGKVFANISHNMPVQSLLHLSVVFAARCFATIACA